jgi:hypothetical protein
MIIQLLIALIVVALLLYILRLVWPADPKLFNIIAAVVVLLVLLYFLGFGPGPLRGLWR